MGADLPPSPWSNRVKIFVVAIQEPTESNFIAITRQMKKFQFNCEDATSPDARLVRGLGQQVDRVPYFPNLMEGLALT